MFGKNQTFSGKAFQKKIACWKTKLEKNHGKKNEKIDKRNKNKTTGTV